MDDGPTPLPQNAEETIAWHHVDARLARVELGLSAFQQSFPRLEGMFNEFALPALRGVMGQIDGLLQRQERNSTRLELFFDEDWPRLQDAVDLLGERLARVERKQDEFVAALALHNDRISRTEKALSVIEIRVDALELDKRDQRVVAAERRRWLSWGKAAYALATAALAIAGYLAGTNL